MYDRRLAGIFGTFGAGSGIRVCFLQTALPASDLSAIRLVHEIRGSDRWPVRDLFQREIDYGRVSEAIVPWMRDQRRVKFFNPLTLTLLPFEDSKDVILPDILHLNTRLKGSEQGHGVQSLEREPFFRFVWTSDPKADEPQRALVEWASSKTLLVAIDGQHRLTATRQFIEEADGSQRFDPRDWQIPVVITALDRVDETGESLTILDVVRSMFVYINTQAQAPSLARQILLNDEVVVDICTQETLQLAHDNDVLPLAERNDSLPPLLMFDWRGETKGGREIRSPFALKGVTEIAAWLQHYLLGEQLSDRQAEGLGIGRNDDLFKRAFLTKQMPPGGHVEIRERFRDSILPGLSYLLSNFAPYQRYISGVRELEKEAELQDEDHSRALALLRFGFHNGDQGEPMGVLNAYHRLVEEILSVKSEIPYLLSHDIGMRGVVCAFGLLKERYEEWTGNQKADWLTYAKWFSANLNRMESGRWFGDKGYVHRLFVTRSPTDEIINYRLEQARRGLGAWIAVVVSSYSSRSGEFPNSGQFQQLWESLVMTKRGLFSTVKGGHRKRLLSELKRAHPEWPNYRHKDQADKGANRAAHKQLQELLDELKMSES